MPIDKRANEWSILRSVYEASDFQDVHEHERPDFLLMRRGSGAIPFGVEVTELFAHEGDARAVNHPGYLPALFDGALHMHKEDPRLLPVVRMRLTDPDGNVKHEDLPGILTLTASDSEHRRALAQVISTKSGRGYDVGGGHINLVIRDRFFLSGEELSEEYSITDLLSDGIREALVESPLNEVFLISISREGEQSIRPLMQLMLVERLFLFGKGLEATTSRPDLDEQWKYVQAFAEYCNRVLDWKVDLLNHRGTPVVAYRSSAVGLGEDWGSELLDFADRATGLESWEWRSDFQSLSDDELQACVAFIDGNRFSWGYRMLAREPAILEYPNVKTVQVVEVPPEQSQDDAAF